ncbi:MAG: transglycosylase domain-containing protein [Lachnospiraceae bacterium]
MNYSKKGTAKKQKKIASKSTLVRKKFTTVFFKAILVCFLALVVIGGCAGIGVYKGILESAPSIESIDATPSGYKSIVYNDEEKEIDTLVASGSNRVYVTISEIPLDMQHAFVAIEDSRFYDHNGIDIRGIIRAGFIGLTSGHFSEGASTITQQLLKNNVFTSWTSESTFPQKLKRKLQEQYLALQLEKTVDKNWILENYLNSINLGQNTLGVQAASQRYFDKDASKLTLSECAVIAAITQSPSHYNPVTHPKDNAKRRKKVLDNMLEQEYISQTQYKKALKDDVYSRIQTVNNEVVSSSASSYFVDELVDQVINDLMKVKGFSETQAYKALYSGGLKIYSTQSSKVQKICEKELANEDNYTTKDVSISWQIKIQEKDGTITNYNEQSLMNYYKQSDKNYNINYSSRKEAKSAIRAFKKIIRKKGGTIVENSEAVSFTYQPQASVSIIDQYTGEVKGLVGGRGDKTASLTLNRASDTTRQPGSTFKVLSSYAPALDSAGMTLATVQDDAPYKYADGTTVHNYDNRYRGFTSLREGIINSINVLAVKTLTDITPQVGYDYLLNFGFTSLSSTDIVQSLALGGITHGVSNLELTAAYATIANNGTYSKPRFYTKILDHDGKVLIDNTVQTHTVLKSSTAWLLTDAMEDVMTRGTGTPANFSGMAVAGKSGTTSNSRDSLFAGFTPYYTCVVWGGYDDNAPLLSTSYVKALWKTIMTQLHTDLEYKEFAKPDDIVSAKICTKSGKLALDGVCNHDPRGSMVKTEYFASGSVPTDYCDHHVSAKICKISGKLAGEFCPIGSIKTGVYIVGGSKNAGDRDYLLPGNLSSSTCPIHTHQPIDPLPPDGDTTDPDAPVDPGDTTDPLPPDEDTPVP